MNLYGINSSTNGMYLHQEEIPHQNQAPVVRDAVEDVTDNMKALNLTPDITDQVLVSEAPVSTQVEAPDQHPNCTSSQFEHCLAKAQAGEPIPAPLRLALYICLSQVGSTKRGLIGINPICAGLLASANIINNAVQVNRTEIAYIFDEFLNAFDKMIAKRTQWSNEEAPCTLENLQIKWHVDYGVNGELLEILEAGYGKVTEARKAVDGPPLPISPSYGLGCKCMYEVANGCASFKGNVIDHSGKLLEEHPWETFYKTGKESDAKLATELSPTIPDDIKLKLENRKIILTRGYTFNQDAARLCATDNWGLVRHLIQEDKDNISLEVGCKVLQLAASAQYKETCIDLFKALPIYDKQSNSYSPLLTVIEHCDSHTFSMILESVESTDQWHFDALKSILESLCVRYRKIAENMLPDAGFYTEELALLAQIWVSAQYPQCKSYYYDIPTEDREKCEITFYKAILSRLATMQIMPNDTYLAFEKSLRGVVERVEKYYGFSSSESPTATALSQPLLGSENNDLNRDALAIVDVEAAKLEDQETVLAMGYTFDSDAEQLALADNWGLLRCLMRGALLSFPRKHRDLKHEL